MPPDLALSSTLIGSNYPCLELIFMVTKVFEPLKFDCIIFMNLYYWNTNGTFNCYMYDNFFKKHWENTSIPLKDYFSSY